MKKGLQIAGIACIVGGVPALLFAALSLHGYYHVLDGSAELYARLYRRAVIFFAAGAALAAAGAVCLIARRKK